MNLSIPPPNQREDTPLGAAGNGFVGKGVLKFGLLGICTIWLMMGCQKSTQSEPNTAPEVAPAEITGLVRDQSGLPLSGVTVQIQNSGFTSETDSEGRYSVPYLPGKFNVFYSRSGYTRRFITLDIAVNSQFPASDVYLIKLPEPAGISAFGPGHYTPILPGDLKAETKLNPEYLEKTKNYGPLERFVSDNNDGEKDLTTFIASGPTAKIANAQDLCFVDTLQIDKKLFKVGPGNVVLSRISSSLSSRDQMEEVPVEKSALIGHAPIPGLESGVILWFLKKPLESGTYAFVSTNQNTLGQGLPGFFSNALGSPLYSPVFLFQVGEGGGLNRVDQPRNAAEISGSLEQDHFTAGSRTEPNTSNPVGSERSGVLNNSPMPEPSLAGQNRAISNADSGTIEERPAPSPEDVLASAPVLATSTGTLNDLPPSGHAPMPYQPRPVYGIDEVFQNGPYANYNLSTRKEILKAVQRALSDAGFYNGPIDGIMGKGSQDGIYAYQLKAGLKDTGLLDVATLGALRLTEIRELKDKVATGGAWVSVTRLENAKDIDYWIATLKISGKNFVVEREYISELRPGSPPWTEPRVANLRRIQCKTVYAGSIVSDDASADGLIVGRIESVRFVPGVPAGFHIYDDARSQQAELSKIGKDFRWYESNGNLVDAMDRNSIFRPK